LEASTITIAKIIKPQGNRGEVGAEILTDFPDRFKWLRDVTLRKEGVPAKGLHLTSFWFHKGRVILKFEGIDSIDAANGLRDYEITLPLEQAMPLPEGTYYHFDLVGCVVRNGTGHEYGKVVEVLESAGTTLLQVNREGGDFLIPFVEPFFRRIDIQKKELICDLPAGLEDL
jgi:16S rRNA processing protein RimM